MADEASTDAEKARKLEAAYQEFVEQMEALKRERLDLVKRVVGRIEQEKIAEVLRSLQ